MNSVVIRCDGSAQVGMGHVMRCLALAEALRRRGVRVRFVAAGSDAAIARLDGAGFEVDVLEHAAALGEPLADTDRDALVSAGQSIDADCVVVDHYGADYEYLAAVAAEVPHLGVIDDLADRDLTPCDWVLNPSPAHEFLGYSLRPQAVRLLGPSYALLGRQFAARRDGLRRTFDPAARRVLVTLGGGSTALRVARLLDAFANVGRSLQIRCVLSHPELVESLRRTPGSRHAIELLPPADDLAPHMQWCDVAIGAGGATSWELCCLGVPMGLIPISENQRPNVIALAAAGCAAAAGSWEDASLDGVARAVIGLLDSPEQRCEMSARGAALVDGHGADRAADAILACRAGQTVEGARR